MSEWSDISKSVGWDLQPRVVSIPRVSTVVKWIKRAKMGDTWGLFQMLQVNRFAPSPSTVGQSQAMRAIVDGLAEVRPIFDPPPEVVNTFRTIEDSNGE